MTRNHFVYGRGIMPWFNSYAHEDARWHELHFELGQRVEQAMEDEALGWSALWDLSYEEYMKREPVGSVEGEG